MYQKGMPKYLLMYEVKRAHLVGEQRVLDCGLQEKAMSWMWVNVRSFMAQNIGREKR